MKLVKYIASVILFIVFIASCTSTKQAGQDIPAIYNGLYEYKLKGSVKEFRHVIVRQKEDTKDKPHYYGNVIDILRGRVFFEFDKNGLEIKFIGIDSINQPITTSIDKLKKRWRYREYDSIDYQEKAQLKLLIKKIPFYVNNPYLLKVNYRRFSPYHLFIENDSSKSHYNIQQYYKYTYDKKGKVQQMQYHMLFDLKELEDKEPFSLHRRVEYKYNDKDQIQSLHYFFKEFRGEFPGGSVEFHELYFGLRGKIHTAYTYDDRGNIKTYSLFSYDVLQYKETYHYNQKDALTSIDRFTISKNTGYKLYDTDNAKIIFNDKGFIQKVIDYKNGTDEVLYTREYKYQYDQYDNWIHADIYYNGDLKEPGFVVERRIEYYEE